MNLFKRLFGFLKPDKKPLKILLLGLDQAGKSSFVNYLQLGKLVDTIPTMGLNVEKVNIDGIEIDILDLAGQETFRFLWEKILDLGADIIIFVVDSSNQNRLVENEAEFRKLILNNPKIKETPICVLANKQDLPDALSPGEVALQMNLLDYTISGDWAHRSINIFPTSMKTGQGIEEVISYLKGVYDKK